MHEENLSVEDLASRSGLSRATILRAVNSNDNARLNVTSATAIANALNTSVGDINWPGGLANNGRPARSGGSYTRRDS